MQDFVKAENVFIDNEAATINEALEFLSRKAVALGIARDADAVLEAFKAREEMGTTGMMNGFAIPHAKSAAITEAAVLVIKFKEPITDWESLDGEPIGVGIALLVPDGEAGTTHIKLLSQVAVLLMRDNFRSSVLASSDPAEIASIVSSSIGV